MESFIEDIIGILVSFLGIGMVWLNEMSMQTHSSFLLKRNILNFKVTKVCGIHYCGIANLLSYLPYILQVLTQF